MSLSSVFKNENVRNICSQITFSRFRKILSLHFIFCTLLLFLQSYVASADAIDGRQEGSYLQKCGDLLVGQYLCSEPAIDPETQQAKGCTQELQSVLVNCSVAPEVQCDGLQDGTFQKSVSCKWTNGHSFETALLLSVFLGWLGVDRFYLGYPAIGLVKFATFGFMFLGQLIDILLIATQVLMPSDGSAYVLDYYGAATTRVFRDNDTYLMPGD